MDIRTRQFNGSGQVTWSSIRFQFRGRLPLMLQTEASECGLACLAMIIAYHGNRVDLRSLRQRFSVSLRGTTLAHLMKFAGSLQLTARPLRVELEDLSYLKTPCILHWDMSHFVVLKEAGKRRIVLYDPALGIRKMSYGQASGHFTGVALELTPEATFVRGNTSRSLRLRDLVGRIVGMKRVLAQIFALAAALELFAIVSPLFLQLSIDKVVATLDQNLLVTLGVGFTLLAGLQAALAGLRNWTTLYFGTSLKIQWYGNLFSHLMRLPVTFFEKRSFGDIMSRFESAENIQRTLTSNFMEAVLDGMISLLMLGVMFLYSGKLALIVLLSVVLYVLLRSVAYQRLRGPVEEQIISMARQQTHFMETLRGIRTIKVFGREDSRKSRWMNLLVDTTNAQVTAEKLNIVCKSASVLIFGVQSTVVVWLGILQVLRGDFTAGMLFAFVAYEEQFKARITILVDRLFEFRMLSLQVQRLSDVVLARPEDNLTDAPGDFQAEPFIEIKSLFFRYSDADPWLLENINLRIEPGECVAVVGPSGAGKSTLLKLIAGLLQPQSGEVVIAGHSVCAGRASVAGKVGFVLQDDTLFGGTISENISFASDAADTARVEECARLACLHDEIMSMPMGYGTFIGDMGSALSGGQRQRLLMARALYQQPSILVLDEATSHLDVATEQRLATVLAELQITRVFAAHRPDTIAIADRVILLSKEGVIENQGFRHSRSTQQELQSEQQRSDAETYVKQ
jgi:ATP-binding cassette subfamily B protein RaxB